jgi:ATP-dependent DNA ligase
LWDVISLEDFKRGYSDESYAQRFSYLTAGVPKINIVESTTVNSADEANEVFRRYYDQGLEGIILKDSSKPWEAKRVKHQVKYKGELVCELKVVGYEVGTGKYEGLLGSLLCESADGLVSVGVGSGFSDSQRNLGPEDYVGKIVSVKYNARIGSKGDKVDSLFLPIFQGVREDKDSADVSKDIK